MTIKNEKNLSKRHDRMFLFFFKVTIISTVKSWVHSWIFRFDWRLRIQYQRWVGGLNHENTCTQTQRQPCGSKFKWVWTTRLNPLDWEHHKSLCVLLSIYFTHHPSSDLRDPVTPELGLPCQLTVSSRAPSLKLCQHLSCGKAKERRVTCMWLQQKHRMQSEDRNSFRLPIFIPIPACLINISAGVWTDKYWGAILWTKMLSCICWGRFTG